MADLVSNWNLLSKLRRSRRACRETIAPCRGVSAESQRQYHSPRLRVRNTALHYREEITVDALVEKLEARLRVWKPETAAQVRERVAEIIELADCDVLDLMRSRVAEQEVLDLLDDPRTW